MFTKEKDSYTLIFIPHSAEQKTLVFRIPKKFVKIFVAVFISVCILSLSFFIYSSYNARKIASYETIKQKMLLQDLQIKKFEDQTNLLSDKLLELTKKENQIRKILGISENKNGFNLKEELDTNSSLDKKLNIINDQLKQRKNSLLELQLYAKSFIEKFNHIPSIWPIYGSIMSYFGYRIFPWRGFHSGIDISANYGAPIKCAADGIVEYTGWKTGYGKTVIIDHGFGYKTLYGHTSAYSVSVGEKVKKGQVIAYVGVTGYATGPHLHYEVIKDGRQINPVPYLDLNLALGSERRL